MTPAVVVLFEDAGWRMLRPLASTRPVWELRLGGHTLGDKLRGHFPGAQFFLCHMYSSVQSQPCSCSARMSLST